MARWVLMLAALAAVSAGCASERTCFGPTENVRVAPGRPPAAAYLINESDASDGRILLYADARGARPKEGRERAMILVTFEVENRSSVAVTLRTDDVEVVDDEGRMLPLEALSSGGAGGNAFEIASSTSDRVTAVFTLPEGTPLTDLGSFRVLWKFAVGDEQRAIETKFVRFRYRRRYYDRYYDPYYHPWYHGPGVHIGIGAAFGF